MAKRICSMLLVVCMVMSMAVASFASNVAFTMEAPAEVEAGSEFVVTIKTSAIADVRYVQAKLNFDKTVLEVVNVGGDICNDFNPEAKNGVLGSAEYKNATDLSEGMVVMAVTFKALDGFEGYTFKLTNVEVVDGTGDEVEVESDEVTVTVKTEEPVCEHAETKEVVTKEATCKEVGSKNIVCAACGEVIKTEEIAKLAHTEEVVAGKEATCTETGLTEGKKCSVCGEVIVEQKEIAKLAHTEEVVAGKEATCTETGLTEGKKCSVCGEVTVAQKEIAKLAHTGGKATCTEKAKCSVCGVAYGELANHNYVDGKCSDCGYVKPVATAKYYTVKAEAGLNGKISPEGSFEVREGKDKTFKITANEGFVIDVLTVDRKEIAKAAGQESYTLTLEDIDENYNIKVTFVKEVAPVVDDKANPSTGANDFVGAAVALAVVSVMGAAVISKK